MANLPDFHCVHWSPTRLSPKFHRMAISQVVRGSVSRETSNFAGIGNFWQPLGLNHDLKCPPCTPGPAAGEMKTEMPLTGNLAFGREDLRTRRRSGELPLRCRTPLQPEFRQGQRTPVSATGCKNSCRSPRIWAPRWVHPPLGPQWGHRLTGRMG